jgi:two-component system OmpR family sensor kinase
MKAGAAPRGGAPIAVQIIALLVAVLIIGQLATLAVLVVLPPPRPPIYRIEEIAAALKGAHTVPRNAPPLVRTLAAAPPKQQPEDFRAAALKGELARVLGVEPDKVALVIEHPGFMFPFGGERHLGRERRFRDRMAGEDAPPGFPDQAPPPWAHPGAPDRLGVSQTMRVQTMRVGIVVGEVEAAVADAPGRWVVVRSPSPGFPNAWQRRMLLWFLACLAILTPIGYLFARRLSAPIARFAAAAERLGRDPNAPPLALTGPAEIGLAAAAFNQMQARLARYVDDRTTMIGAIAHDLRTPIARVQFKLNRAPDAIAADIRGDLGQMEAMLAAVLAFVRDAAPAQERAPLDLLSVLEVVADDAADTGADVALEPAQPLIVDGDAAALRRLFANLVDNAVKYGRSARIRLTLAADEAVVEIKDQGPGLSSEEVERVFEPFYRVEGSRNRETGGIGLGLSVARSVARAHGGDVSLETGPEGLTATVRLPGARSAR